MDKSAISSKKRNHSIIEETIGEILETLMIKPSNRIVNMKITQVTLQHYKENEPLYVTTELVFIDDSCSMVIMNTSFGVVIEMHHYVPSLIHNMVNIDWIERLFTSD